MKAIEEVCSDSIRYILFTGTKTLNTLHLSRSTGHLKTDQKPVEGIDLIYMEKKNEKP